MTNYQDRSLALLYTEPGQFDRGPSDSAAVVVTHLAHGYEAEDGSVTPVLEDIELTVERGEFVAIVGPSGCGKTTLLNLLSGLEPLQHGHVEVLSDAPKAGNRNVGYLFARDSLLPWRTVIDNVGLGLELAGFSKADRNDKSQSMLARVGLNDFAGAFPAQLSQGMRQRVAIARTLVSTPELLLLDEPFSALDAQTKLLLQDTFCELWSTLQSTVVLITHDLAESIALADRVVLMTARPGRIKRVYRVDLPRPRSVFDLQSDDRFHRIYESLWADLRDEVVPR